MCDCEMNASGVAYLSRLLEAEGSRGGGVRVGGGGRGPRPVLTLKP